MEYKSDNSPLTLADKNAHGIISKGLGNLYPHLPLLSEEGSQIPFETRETWDYFWLVDPLDGTKEFVKKNGEFTVNIALIHDNKPVLGVVYAPVKSLLFYAKAGEGAYFKEGDLVERQIKGSHPPAESPFIVIGSRSHGSPEFDKYMDTIKSQHDAVKVLAIGSSLKLCYVAAGLAHIYPRLGPTMEWDTAAAHAIVKEAGKGVYDFNSRQELSYNKKNLRNNWFIVE